MHKKRLTISHLKNPPYMWDLFTKKVVEYDLRIKILCKFPPARSQRCGTNSLKFKNSLQWSSLGDKVKTAQSLAIYIQTKNQNPGMALIALVTSAETSY